MMWLIANRQLVAKFIFAAVVLLVMWLCYGAGQRNIQEKWEKEKAIQTMEIIKSNAISAFIQIGLNVNYPPLTLRLEVGASWSICLLAQVYPSSKGNSYPDSTKII